MFCSSLKSSSLKGNTSHRKSVVEFSFEGKFVLLFCGLARVCYSVHLASYNYYNLIRSSYRSPNARGDQSAMVQGLLCYLRSQHKNCQSEASHQCYCPCHWKCPRLHKHAVIYYSRPERFNLTEILALRDIAYSGRLDSLRHNSQARRSGGQKIYRRDALCEEINQALSC